MCPYGARSRFVFITLVAVVFALGVWRQLNLPATAPLAFTPPPVITRSVEGIQEIARHDIPMPANTPAAHASFLLADKNKLKIFWFAGTRESAPDVQIVSSDYEQGVWSPAIVIVNRHTAADALGFGAWIRRLGNPVAWIDMQGRTHLYVVATGLGGWAASRILHLRQDAPHLAFQPLGFLQLSPLFNLSTLVRAAPVSLMDGGVLLPAYFEMGVKYPLAIRLNADGEVVPNLSGVTHMGGDLAALQPSVVVHSGKNAIAYLRDDSLQQQLKIVQTFNGGATWHSVQGGAQGGTLPRITNPDSGIAAVRLPDGSTLLVRNPDPTGRQRLVMERSMDGLTDWQLLATLEDGHKTQAEYSYPSAVLMGHELHVSYTYQRRWIRHVVFELPS